jgi:acetyl-CoA acetyltransferase
MSAERAQELGYTPLATVAALSTVALDPREDLLLGPAWAIPRALDQAGIGLSDVGVVELHEAFAAQVLANLVAMSDPAYCRDVMGRDGAVGEIDPARLNAWGGSLAIGHPFGATGGRLVITAARRMAHENQRWGLVSACAAGGLGSALVLRRD